jgi:uncharacterized protein (TIGR02145 family)
MNRIAILLASLLMSLLTGLPATAQHPVKCSEKTDKKGNVTYTCTYGSFTIVTKGSENAEKGRMEWSTTWYTGKNKSREAISNNDVALQMFTDRRDELLRLHQDTINLEWNRLIDDPDTEDCIMEGLTDTADVAYEQISLVVSPEGITFSSSLGLHPACWGQDVVSSFFTWEMLQPYLAMNQHEPFDTKTASYGEVRIGDQLWMSKNLDVERFRNGDIIPQVKSHVEWLQAGNKAQPAWCFYENKTSNGAKYGKLYNGYAVMDPRGLAPNGWHIATEQEWKTLRDYCGGSSEAGKRLKSTSGWKKPGNGTDSFGFAALPAGIHSESYTTLGNGRGYAETNEYHFLGEQAFWWTTTRSDNGALVCIYMGRGDGIGSTSNYGNYGGGYSVRCVKD